MTPMREYKILHLEDSMIFIEVFEKFIKNKKYINNNLNIKYDVVYTMENAYEWLKSERPDLLIVDLMLLNDYDPTPGEEFIKDISGKFPNLKMMALTGYHDDGPRKRIGKYVVHYQKKAFRPSMFGKQIMQILKEDQK